MATGPLSRVAAAAARRMPLRLSMVAPSAAATRLLLPHALSSSAAVSRAAGPTRVSVPAVGAWGDLAKCSRAVRVGDHVRVAGTCAQGDTVSDQFRAIFGIIEPALAEVGATLGDVTVCRVFAADVQGDWEEIGAVHGEVFGDTRPCCTLVGATLLAPWMKVEVEVEAHIASSSTSSGAARRSAVRGSSPLYSSSQTHDGVVYVSGQVGLLPGTMTLADGGVQEQAWQALTNMKERLEEAGSSLSSVLKCSCLLNDIRDFDAFNEVYLEFFPDLATRPARICHGPGGLPLGALVEVECVAVRDDAK